MRLCICCLPACRRAGGWHTCHMPAWWHSAASLPSLAASTRLQGIPACRDVVCTPMECLSSSASCLWDLVLGRKFCYACLLLACPTLTFSPLATILFVLFCCLGRTLFLPSLPFTFCPNSCHCLLPAPACLACAGAASSPCTYYTLYCLLCLRK